MKQIVIFGLIIVAASSCKQMDIERELGLIDSLKAEIKKSEIIIDRVDSEQIKSRHEQMSNQITIAKSLYGDSIAWEKAKVLSKYHQVRKSFRKYLDKRSYIEDELDYSYQQLVDLASDMQNNIISADSFPVYFEKECNAAKDLDALIKTETEKAKSSLKLYEEYAPMVEELLREQNTEEEV